MANYSLKELHIRTQGKPIELKNTIEKEAAWWNPQENRIWERPKATLEVKCRRINEKGANITEKKLPVPSKCEMVDIFSPMGDTYDKITNNTSIWITRMDSGYSY